jgi:DNA-binding CsgD family transcriptional regulator
VAGEGVESNAEIAERLGIELGTAKVHMANIYRKAGRSTKLSLILAFAKDVR